MASFLLLLSLATIGASASVLPSMQLAVPVAPIDGQPIPAPRARQRVLLIVVDGLRADLAAEQPFLRELAQRGVRVELRAEAPSYSAPQYVAMLTGVPPLDSGVRNNFHLARTPLDNLARRVRAGGGRTHVVSDEVDWWARLYGDDFDGARVVAPGTLNGEMVGALRSDHFVVAHLCGVDRAGHREGAASKSYRDAARTAVANAHRLAEAWGWPAAPVVVLSDHGHRLGGGHGGDEPDVRGTWMVAGGPGLREGATVGGARMIDVAPTIAALLGVPTPRQAQGRTLFDALALPPGSRAALESADRDRVRLAVAAAETPRRDLLDREALGRWIRLAVMVVVFAMAAVALRRGGRPAWLGLRTGIVALALTAVAFAVWYGPPSLSADRSGLRLVFGTGVLAIATSAPAFASAIVTARRRRLSAIASGWYAIGAVIGASPVAAYAFVQVGAFQTRITCEPTWLTALALISYCAFAPPLLAAFLVVVIAARRSPEHTVP